MREREDLSGYTLIKRIGFGGMSTVYEAMSPSGERVALKRMNPGLIGDDSGRARFLREIAMLQRVSNPHVAQILDVEIDDDLFIVTELIDGPTLEQDVIDSGVFTGTDLVELAQELADALRSIHRVGVLHRDMKPSNVMIGEQGIVLIDFGIAQAEGATRLTQAGSVAHTPGYVDPRIIRGEVPDEAADWWALAAVIGFAACGHPIFHGAPAAIMRQILCGEPDLDGMDPAVARVVSAALVPDVSKRLSFDELIDALRDPSGFVTDEEADVVAPPLPETSDDAEVTRIDDADERTQVMPYPEPIVPVTQILDAEMAGGLPDHAIPVESTGITAHVTNDSDSRQLVNPAPPRTSLPRSSRVFSLLMMVALSILSGWNLLLVGLILGGTFVVSYIVGGFWERAARGKKNGFVAVWLLPLMFVRALLMAAIGGAVALLGGFGSLWLILQLMGTHYVLNDLRWMIVASVFVAQLLLWNVDWGRQSRLGWQRMVEEITPSASYYVFWCAIGIALCMATLGLILGESASNIPSIIVHIFHLKPGAMQFSF
ncbi:serine/threonine-protein kinase [Arcanobacterium haemolyticum]|uniref:non-specific serine/threonine protein kinase n=1 Tax=Arcanobacterium haemolyticum (strain ATCC 9345 / DSM 20595 / CCM 5947 / CCUG 17215 / LMG 16163 / NBRC 15585 / NCTC 8452 / 11018) TaxID=644284 RepID=D7BKZ9_ARCHD|nr:serine/threonine-protein kinase [Arcanobacterium haemolyticum]ADH93329.1 serine/threonine protein kinase [Arcanobacterium haemolyticum DSM 20595]SQH27838.1 Serine/threonine-protein kinase AfsK [Arcanobacterium haemolyticum]